jgi:hypothetical protein
VESFALDIFIATHQCGALELEFRIIDCSVTEAGRYAILNAMDELSDTRIERRLSIAIITNEN